MVFYVEPWGWQLASTQSHAGVAMIPRIGTPCRRVVPKEYLGTSMVSLVHSCVSRCPEMASCGEEHMVYSSLGLGSRG